MYIVAIAPVKAKSRIPKNSSLREGSRAAMWYTRSPTSICMLVRLYNFTFYPSLCPTLF